VIILEVGVSLRRVWDSYPEHIVESFVEIVIVIATNIMVVLFTLNLLG
jgi:hypothetical protein